MRVQYKPASRYLRILIVLVCCLNLCVLEPSTPLFTASAQSPSPELKRIYDLYRAKETAYNTAASAYDAEINKFRTMSTMPLTTTDDARKIIEAMQRVVSNGMKRVYDRSVIVARNNATFKSGLEASATRLTAKTLMLQIQQDPASLTRISGYDSAVDAVRRKLAADNALLNQVSSKLREFAQRRGALSPSPSQDPLRTLLGDAAYRSPSPAGFGSSSMVKVSYGPSVAIPGAIEAALIAAAVVLIGAYAARRGEDISEPADPKNEADTRSRFAICVDEATARRDNCLRAGDFFGDLLCLSLFTSDMAICILLPN